MAYSVSPLSRDELDDILRDYVCSTCWGSLSFHYIEGRWYAVCPGCGEETKGYTSKAFAERRREESTSELFEAERNLREIMGLHEKQTVEKNLKDIGF
ncbi:MAG: hypothetical protein EHM40_02990 [Chloroflexi bacterium]|nr:MAG: hypothetical protein EHM40_02990 [Chloroflexota bacterium]